MAVMTLAMLGLAYHTFVALPATYRTLRERGVLANARVVKCGRDDCTLSYVHAGRTHRNRYSHDGSQFDGRRLALVLVDPRHPSTMYTVRDVQRETNAGWSGLGVFCLLAVAFFGGLTFVFARALYRFVPVSELRPEVPTRIPESRRLALEAIDATQDLLYDGTFPSRYEQSFRFDPEELAASVAYLRERLAALPAREELARGLGDEIARLVGEARPMRVIGGVRLDPGSLHLRLEQLRVRVAAAGDYEMSRR
jgi:hypothetical protein